MYIFVNIGVLVYSPIFSCIFFPFNNTFFYIVTDDCCYLKCHSNRNVKFRNNTYDDSVFKKMSSEIIVIVKILERKICYLYTVTIKLLNENKF